MGKARRKPKSIPQQEPKGLAEFNQMPEAEQASIREEFPKVVEFLESNRRNRRSRSQQKLTGVIPMSRSPLAEAKKLGGS